MTDTTLSTPGPRKLWVRALLMLLMMVAFYIAAWVLFFTALLQLILAAVTDAPNARLKTFGQNVGRYLGQIADFGSFTTEELPFPFSDWPSADTPR